MDVGRAFTYVTEDPEWVKKVLLGGVVILVSVVLSIVVIGILGFFIVAGYFIETIRRVHAGAPSPLPEWSDLGSFLSKGFIASVGLIIWYIPIIAIGACIAAISSSSDSNAVGGFTLLASCVSLPVYIVIGILIAPVVLARYAVYQNFGAMFQFSEIYVEIRKALVPLLIVFVISLVASFISYLGLIACVVGFVFTSFYAGLIYSFAVGDMYRQATDAVPAAEAAF